MTNYKITIRYYDGREINMTKVLNHKEIESLKSSLESHKMIECYNIEKGEQ